jgi:extradiol dioxygenase family protein
VGHAAADGGARDAAIEQFWRSHRRGRARRLIVIRIDPRQENIAVITRLNVASIYVLDKDQALDFYVNKLGLEKGSDFTQGNYRWLTVRVPSQPDVEISLEQPGEPLHDEATAEQLRELVTKGALSGLVFHTDDVRGLYEHLQERGVTDFTQEPMDHFYGTDMGLRDPFGNAIRILERATNTPAATA